MMKQRMENPTKRIVEMGEDGQLLVVELTPRLLIMRPYRSKNPQAQVALPWGAIYRRGMMVKSEEEQQAKRKGPKKVKRSVI